jgi:hypothetical protein
MTASHHHRDHRAIPLNSTFSTRVARSLEKRLRHSLSPYALRTSSLLVLSGVGLRLMTSARIILQFAGPACTKATIQPCQRINCASEQINAVAFSWWISSFSHRSLPLIEYSSSWPNVCPSVRFMLVHDKIAALKWSACESPDVRSRILRHSGASPRVGYRKRWQRENANTKISFTRSSEGGQEMLAANYCMMKTRTKY